MSPALTEMVVELGGGAYIVGRSPFCSAVDVDVPVVGDLLNVHWERLARIRPTHVLVQCSEDMLDPSLQQLASRRGWILVAHPLISADDIRSTMTALPDQLDLPEADAAVARKRAAGFQRECDEQIGTGNVLAQERVLLVSPMEPPLAWGTATYLGQIAEKMGAVNALTLEGWAPIGYEDIIRCRADRIVIVSALEPDPDHTLFVALDRLPADVEVCTLVHPNLNLPAAHLPDITRTFRRLIASEQGR